ncbi:Muellerian-inhibiting factor, partial [Tinamus guttatus]
VTWEAQAKLRFQLLFQAAVGRSLGGLRFALLLFYVGRGAAEPAELLATGSVSFLSAQRLCLSRDTQFLVLGASVASVNRTDEQLSFEVSLAIWHRGGAGVPLPSAEVQRLLFGSDDKCFTRMTPVLLLLAKAQREEDSLAASSYLSAAGVVEVAPAPVTPSLCSPRSPPEAGSEELPSPTLPSWVNASAPAPGGSSQFLDILTRFIRQVLSPSSEPPTQPSSHHWLDFQKLQDIPSFQANMGLFQHLLSCCCSAPGPGEGQAGEQPPGSGKLHTLLLLKALQTVRARWQERRKVLRQNRSARHQAHCRLQELTIDLQDRKFIVMPTVYAANNCEGPCKLPLSTRVPSYSSHTVLLLGMQERGSPLRRAPCCVPVRYSDQLIISVSSEGLEVRKFPNMVAEECGCR